MLNALIARLGDFVKLTKLDIRFQSSHDYRESVERIVKQCRPGIKELALGTDETPRVWADGKADTAKWMREAQVEQYHSVEKIEDYLATADLVEYNMYKFPNVKELSLMYSIGSYDVDAKRILDAVKHVNKLNLDNFDLEKVATVKHYVSVMKCQHNELSLFTQSPDMMRHSIEISGNRDSQADTSDIAISVSEYLKPATLKKLFALFGNIAELNVSLNRFEDGFGGWGGGFDMDEEETALDFQAVWRLLPHAEKLQFTANKITNQPADTKKASLNKLHTLTLIDAKIDEEMLEFIQRSAPHLSNLTLKNFLLISKTSPHQRIRMPKTAFSTLSLIGKWGSFEARDFGELPENSIHGRWIKPQAPQTSMLLQVTALATKRPAQYFALSVGKPSTCESISQQAFEENPNALPVLEIECKSLTLLKFGLGALTLDMKFSPQGDFENVVAF